MAVEYNYAQRKFSPIVTRLSGRILIASMGLSTAVALIGSGPAEAAQATVGLGTAASYAVVAGTTVTNTGASTISGNLGVSPGTSVTGFPPGTVINGTIQSATTSAAQAQSDLTTAYNDAAGRTPVTTVTADLGGQTLVPGVYSGGALGLTGTLTLDAQGNSSAVFIFQASSTLITASSSTIALIGGANACNVFWQVGSSATLGTSSVFVGSVLALTSIAADTGASVSGRLLARNGAVTLDTNTITSPTGCASTASTTTTTAASTTTTTAGTTTAGTTITTVGSTGATTTTSASKGVIVPPVATGEPWSGWMYWAILASIGGGGTLLLGLRRRAGATLTPRHR